MEGYVVFETIPSLTVVIWLLLIASIFWAPDKWKNKGIRIEIKNKKLIQFFEDRNIKTPEKRGLFLAVVLAIITLILSSPGTGFYLFFVLMAGAILGQKFGPLSMLTVTSLTILQNPQFLFYGRYYNEILLIIYILLPVLSAHAVGRLLDNNKNKKLNKYIIIMSIGWGILFLPAIILLNYYYSSDRLFNNIIVIFISAYLSQRIETGRAILPTQLEIDALKQAIADAKLEIKTQIEHVPQVTEIILNFHTLIIEVKNSLNKEPLSDINVMLKPVEGEPFERKSDIDGKVIFGKVKEGNYTLIINSPGFGEVSQEMTLNKNDRIIIELQGKANLTINALDIVNENGIADAVIKFGDREVRTDEKGIAIISDVPFGKYDLTVTKETYKTESATQVIKEIQQDVKIFLKPDIKLNEEYALKCEQLRHSLNESMKKLSSACDMCIPEYYKNVCFELIKLNETIAITPVYVYADQSVDKINALFKITGMICKEMELILTNSENITEFITMAERGIKATPKITINSADYDNMVRAYMKDPTEFSLKYKTQILNKLHETDKEITDKLQVFNINPVANMWSISQNIIAHAKNEHEEVASLLLANILLDATKNMFKTYEIIKRLKK